MSHERGIQQETTNGRGANGSMRRPFFYVPPSKPISVWCRFCPSREQTLTHGLPRIFTSPSSHTEAADQNCGRNAAHSGYSVGFQVDAPLGFEAAHQPALSCRECGRPSVVHWTVALRNNLHFKTTRSVSTSDVSYTFRRCGLRCH